MSSRQLTDAQRVLVEENIKLVPFTINKFFGREAAGNEDLRQIGALGLCNAAANYRLETGVKFTTYAIKSICTAIISEWKKQHAQKRFCDEAPLHLNQTMTNDEGDEIEMMATLSDPHSDTEQSAINRVLYEKVIQFCPTHVRMENEGLNIAGIAKSEKITKQGAKSKLMREYRRAALALGIDGRAC